MMVATRYFSIARGWRRKCTSRICATASACNSTCARVKRDLKHSTCASVRPGARPVVPPMEAVYRILSLTFRTLQMIVWGGIGVGIFGWRFVIESIRDRRAGKASALRALGRALRLMLEGLGATFVKVGQIMSTRPDLLPSEIVGELVQLQENVR